MRFPLPERQGKPPSGTPSRRVSCTAQKPGCLGSYDTNKLPEPRWYNDVCHECRHSKPRRPRAPDAISPVITASVLAGIPSVRTSRHRACTPDTTNIFRDFCAMFSLTHCSCIVFFVLGVLEQASSQSRVDCVGPANGPNFPACQSHFNRKKTNQQALERGGWRDGRCLHCRSADAPHLALLASLPAYPDGAPALSILVRVWFMLGCCVYEYLFFRRLPHSPHDRSHPRWYTCYFLSAPAAPAAVQNIFSLLCFWLHFYSTPIPAFFLVASSLPHTTARTRAPAHTTAHTRAGTHADSFGAGIAGRRPKHFFSIFSPVFVLLFPALLFYAHSHILDSNIAALDGAARVLRDRFPWDMDSVREFFVFPDVYAHENVFSIPVITCKYTTVCELTLENFE